MREFPEQTPDRIGAKFRFKPLRKNHWRRLPHTSQSANKRRPVAMYKCQCGASSAVFENEIPTLHCFACQEEIVLLGYFVNQEPTPWASRSS